MIHKLLNNLKFFLSGVSNIEAISPNKGKLDENINRWKNYPNSSKERRIYDKYTLDFKLYLEKHYSPNIYSTWSRWVKWFAFIDAAFDNEKHLEYKIKTGYYRVDYNFKKYIECLNDITELEKLPLDITKVIVFLKMDGFFGYYKVNISDWLLMKNFCNPETEIQQEKYSIIELLELENGDNYLREQLINLKWWDITRGDPQGH